MVSKVVQGKANLVSIIKHNLKGSEHLVNLNVSLEDVSGVGYSTSQTSAQNITCEHLHLLYTRCLSWHKPKWVQGGFNLQLEWNR